eukprot:6344830-Pyramimonas_sp.AAC.1
MPSWDITVDRSMTETPSAGRTTGPWRPTSVSSNKSQRASMLRRLARRSATLYRSSRGSTTGMEGWAPKPRAQLQTGLGAASSEQTDPRLEGQRQQDRLRQHG